MNSEEMEELIEQIKALIAKLDKPKKDLLGWSTILTSFLATVVIAGLSLYYSNLESERSFQNSLQQLELQKRNLRVEELKALNDLIPSIASKDSVLRNTAYKLLEAVNSESTKDLVPSQNPSSNLLTHFAGIALRENASFIERNEAMKNLRDIAINPKSSRQVKDEATGVITKLAISEKVPDEVRQVAKDYLKDIVSLPRNSFVSHLNREQTNRNVEEIILHHTYLPAIKNYKGSEIINSLVKFHIENNNWSYAGWHFMISPDGLIWTGRPMNVNWTGVAGYRNQAISITLLLNGDEELPTDEQRKSLVTVINTLCKKLNINSNDNFSSHRGFHRDHNSPRFAGKTCPGKLITKEMVLNWLNASDQKDLGNSKNISVANKLTKEELLDSLKKIIVEELNVGFNEIRMESNFTEDLGAGYEEVVFLIMKIEKKFNVSIPDKDGEKMITVKTIFDYLVTSLKISE